MDQEFYKGNRKALYEGLEPGSLVVLFSGTPPWKTDDEEYSFYADRSFVYMTGIEQRESVFLAQVDEGGVKETLYLLPPNLMKERWTGKRIRPEAAEEISGIDHYEDVAAFAAQFRTLALSGDYRNLCLDINQRSPEEPAREAMRMEELRKKQYPWLNPVNLHPAIKKIRAIKKPCEIEAMRIGEKITGEGIEAMMRASKPGMYEYQYKAEYDYVLSQHGVLAPGFPSIICGGENNFCIHYYSYRGQVQDGDMVLNDVGAIWDHEINDVSRGWPCNGHFTEKQRLLYECAYATSNHMFEILKPGIPMDQVDLIARRYCYERLHDIGLCKSYDDIGTYMWHAGAHHVGFDVHDVVDSRGLTRPGFVFCVDVGIYCEAWGIGFRLEDNCLITEGGCENLSSMIPRSIEDIEAVMNG